MIKKLFFISFILLLVPIAVMAQAVPAGEVIDLQGEALIQPAGGTAKPAALKQTVAVGDKLETKATGALKILFVDDTILTLKENSKTLITEFLFDPKAGKRKTVLNVLAGKARTTVGKFFGDDQMVEIKTPTAVAGIRGTDVGVLVKRIKTNFYCFDGEFISYNIDFPDKVVSVKEGLGIEISAGVPASTDNLAPIPADIQSQSFDISLTTQPEMKQETKEAAAASSAATAGTASSAYGVEGSGRYGSYGASYGMYSSSGGYAAYSSGMSSSYGSVSFSQYMVYSTSQSASTATSSSAFDGMSSGSSGYGGGSGESQSMQSASQAQSYESTYTSGAYGGWESSDTQILPGGESEATSTSSDTSGVDVEFPE